MPETLARRTWEGLSEAEKREVKVLGSIALMKPILDKLDVAQIINGYCSDGSEFSHGKAVEIMVANRLMAPKPLYHVEQWAKEIAVEEVYGIPPEKLNDDRLGRALDAIYPYLGEIWDRIVAEAIVTYNLDFYSIIYDVTSFYFEGEYEGSELIQYGYSRDWKPDKVQANLGLDVTSKEGVPLSYKLLPGSTADENTVLENIDRLKALRERLPKGSKAPILVIGDGKTISPKAVLKYHEICLDYLAPVKTTEKIRELVQSVSDEEFEDNRLNYKGRDEGAYWAVFRPFTFCYEGRKVEDLALVVKSTSKLSRDRASRMKAIEERSERLKHIQSKLNQRKYKSKGYVERRVHKALKGSRIKKYFRVEVTGEYGNLSLNWSLDNETMERDKALDGKYILVSSRRFSSAEEMFLRYKERNRVEQRISNLKGNLRVRPVFLEREERIASLVFVIVLSLLVFSIVEALCRRGGLTKMTARAAFGCFEHLSLMRFRFKDGSSLVVVGELLPVQDAILNAMCLPRPQAYVGLHR